MAQYTSLLPPSLPLPSTVSLLSLFLPFQLSTLMSLPVTGSSFRNRGLAGWGGRAIRFYKIFSDFCSWDLNNFLCLKRTLIEKYQILNIINSLNVKEVTLCSKNGKLLSKLIFFKTKLAILRPDSFIRWELILLPWLYGCKIKCLRHCTGSKNQKKVFENRITLAGRGGATCCYSSPQTWRLFSIFFADDVFPNQ